MIKVVGWVGLCLFLPLVGEAQLLNGQPPPSRWIARYSVSHLQQVVGEMRRETQLGEQSYSIQSDLTPKGVGRLFGGDLIEQASSGVLLGKRLRPQHYFFFQSSKPNKPRDFSFDWSANKVTFVDQVISFSGELHDELSQMLELRRRLAAGDQLIELQVLSGSKRRVYDYRYRVEAEEAVAVLPAEAAVAEPAIRVLLTTSRGKYEMRFWMGVERDYLPLRIERTEIRKQRTGVMVLTGFEQRAAAE